MDDYVVSDSGVKVWTTPEAHPLLRQTDTTHPSFLDKLAETYSRSLAGNPGSPQAVVSLTSIYRCNSRALQRITYTVMPYKTVIRLLIVARNPANDFSARLLGGELAGLPRILSENSEDACTWHYFSPLLSDGARRGQALEELLRRTFPELSLSQVLDATPFAELIFWPRLSPPLCRPQREGDSEPDVLIRLGDQGLVLVEVANRHLQNKCQEPVVSACCHVSVLLGNSSSPPAKCESVSAVRPLANVRTVRDRPKTVCVVSGSTF